MAEIGKIFNSKYSLNYYVYLMTAEYSRNYVNSLIYLCHLQIEDIVT